MTVHIFSRLFLLSLILLSNIHLLYNQITLEGYLYESGNRGFISGAEVSLLDSATNSVIVTTLSDKNGKYTLRAQEPGDYLIYIIQEPFFESMESFSISDESTDRYFFKHELNRKPGYLFEMTLSEKSKTNGGKDALNGASVEVYNNTTNREEFRIDQLNRPDFQMALLKGNHYTILVRKLGFISKRLEAYVDVKDCILCFEGISNVRPAVTDNLTDNNDNGTLLANIEMERLFDGQVLAFNNIYYDYNKVAISDSSLLELDRVALFLKDNPGISIELGSHTDSKGQKEANLRLSQKRAQLAVDYLVHTGGVAQNRLRAKGYGESNLINHCKDGVACTSIEHSQNRRTEFKVVNFDTSVKLISLREIKVDEMMHNLIEELGTTQIVINEGEDINTRIKDAEDEIAGDKRIYSEKKNQIKTISMATSLIVNTTVIAPELESKGNTNTIEKNEVSKVADVENVNDEQLKMIPENYTGYKIAIKFSRYALKKDDQIFRDNPSLFHFITADRNHLYLIGHFSTKRSAEAYLKNKVQDKYPYAYVAGYEKGIRTY